MNYRKHDYCIALGKDGAQVTTRQGTFCMRCWDRIDVYDPSVEKVKELLTAQDLNSQEA